MIDLYYDKGEVMKKILLVMTLAVSMYAEAYFKVGKTIGCYQKDDLEILRIYRAIDSLKLDEFYYANCRIVKDGEAYMDQSIGVYRKLFLKEFNMYVYVYEVTLR